MKRKETVRVLVSRREAAGIYSLRLAVTFAEEVKAGQFVSLFSADGGRLLPRPISVCEADPEDGSIRLVYRIAGAGTEEFSRLRAGETIEVMGPLGNGFPVGETAGKRVLLVGGGIGIPPMLACAREMTGERRAAKGCPGRPCEVTFAVGYRSADTYLLEELRRTAPVILATDDGSLGTCGTVVDAIRERKAEADVIFACGPKPMLRAVKSYAAERGISCYVSLEERMACGVGVCLGCVCRTTKTDAHSLVKNARVCKDGPVFRAEEVDLS